MTALIYEQFNPIIAVYQKLLQKRGFEVFATKEFHTAWEHYEKTRPDLVIAKFEAVAAHDAPSGVALVEKIRQSGDEATPIVIVGHEIYRPDEMRLLTLKVGGILRLPFGEAAFFTVLDSASPTAHPPR